MAACGEETLTDLQTRAMKEDSGRRLHSQGFLLLPFRGIRGRGRSKQEAGGNRLGEFLAPSFYFKASDSPSWLMSSDGKNAGVT